MTGMSRIRFFVLALFVFSMIEPGALRAQSVSTVAQGNTTPGGLVLPPPFSWSTLVTESGLPTEESVLALNDNYAAIVSPGDAGLLKILDQDDATEWIRLSGGVGFETGLIFPVTGFTEARSLSVEEQAFLVLKTHGAGIWFYAEEDDPTPLFPSFLWASGPVGGSTTLMLLDEVGDLFVAGQYTSGSGPLATLLLRGEPLERGDPVRLDPTRALTVIKADGEAPIIGVVTEHPGMTLGGGISSADDLAHEWGEEVLAIFIEERESLEEELLAENEALREEAGRLESAQAYAGFRGVKADDVEGVAERYDEALRVFEQRLATAVLRRFVSRHFVSVAFAGRAEIKAHPAAGPIAIGDRVLADPLTGLAIPGDGAGRELGVALEPRGADRDTVKVLLKLGAGSARDPLVAANEIPSRRITELELRLAKLEAERGTLLERLAALEALTGPGSPQRSLVAASSRQDHPAGEDEGGPRP